MGKKSFFSLILSLMVALSFTIFSAEAVFKPGKYLGSYEGYGGPVKVEVTTSKDRIENVVIIEHKESKGISDHAIESLPKEIVANQSVAVDYVAGASKSSKAIIEATKEALKFSGVSIAAISKPVTKKAVENIILDKEAEVIVVGAGGAGLAAGVSAYENGAKSVIILEKMPIIGGNTIRAGGAYNAVNPKKQKAQGIEDSIDKHFTQTYEGGNKVANPKLVRTLVENAMSGVDWLEGLGMKWNEKIGSVVGSMWPRTNQATDPLGTGYINTLEKAFLQHGGKIYTNTKVVRILKKDNRVIGVTAIGADGKEVEFTGKKGVILASGGYAANSEMVREFLSDGVYTKDKLPAGIENTNHPGATGEVIKMALDAGADVIDMKHIQLLPMPADRFGPTINVENVIFVNKDGNRYVREDGRRDEISLATFAQKDGQYYMINDSKIISPDRKTTSAEDLDELIRKNTVVEAPTLEELAKKINIPAAALVATVNKFNESVDKKSDEFGRDIWENKIDKGPFYATLRFPALHHTMGGIKINENAEVIGKDGKIVPGLFAAGEVTGGIHGANRLGGNAIADIIVFGRIAGKNAANAK